MIDIFGIIIGAVIGCAFVILLLTILDMIGLFPKRTKTPKIATGGKAKLSLIDVYEKQIKQLQKDNENLEQLCATRGHLVDDREHGPTQRPPLPDKPDIPFPISMETSIALLNMAHYEVVLKERDNHSFELYHNGYYHSHWSSIGLLNKPQWIMDLIIGFERTLGHRSAHLF